MITYYEFLLQDNLATEMFNFVAKEAEHSSKLISVCLNIVFNKKTNSILY